MRYPAPSKKRSADDPSESSFVHRLASGEARSDDLDDSDAPPASKRVRTSPGSSTVSTPRVVFELSSSADAKATAAVPSDASSDVGGVAWPGSEDNIYSEFPTDDSPLQAPYVQQLFTFLIRMSLLMADAKDGSVQRLSSRCNALFKKLVSTVPVTGLKIQHFDKTMKSTLDQHIQIRRKAGDQQTASDIIGGYRPPRGIILPPSRVMYVLLELLSNSLIDNKGFPTQLLVQPRQLLYQQFQKLFASAPSSMTDGESSC